MASRTSAGSLGLNTDWNLGEDNWKDGVDQNWLKLSVLTQGVAISTVAATPGSPAERDVYIFSDTHPTQPNKIAAYDEGAWVYITPTRGWMIYDTLAGVMKQFNGTVWAPFTSGGGVAALAGGLTKLAEFTVTAAQATIDLAGITQAYDDLVITVVGRGTQAAASVDLTLRVNNDSAANYDWCRWNRFSATAQVAQTSAQFGSVPAGSAPAGRSGSTTIELLDYAKTAFVKTAHAVSDASLGTIANDQLSQLVSLAWRNTAAVNRITLGCSAGNFEVGTHVVIYGRGGAIPNLVAALPAQGTRATRSTTQAIASTTYAAIAFDATTSDEGGLWNVANPSRMTIKEDGWYAISAEIIYANVSGGIRFAFIWKNDLGLTAAVNALTGASVGTSGGGDRLAISTIAKLVAGDVIQLVARQSATGSVNVGLPAGNDLPHLAIVKLPTPVTTKSGEPVTTVLAAPSPVGQTGSSIYVTNPAVGNPRPYWSDGTNWRDATGTLLA